MTAFLIAFAALIIGYAVYGKIVDSMFGPTDRTTPAVRLNDGVDYMPLPTWKVFPSLLSVVRFRRSISTSYGAIFRGQTRRLP